MASTTASVQFRPAALAARGSRRVSVVRAQAVAQAPEPVKIGINGARACQSICFDRPRRAIWRVPYAGIACLPFANMIYSY